MFNCACEFVLHTLKFAANDSFSRLTGNFLTGTSYGGKIESAITSCCLLVLICISSLVLVILNHTMRKMACPLWRYTKSLCIHKQLKKLCKLLRSSRSLRLKIKLETLLFEEWMIYLSPYGYDIILCEHCSLQKWCLKSRDKGNEPRKKFPGTIKYANDTN